jgi:hypothetical protein
MAGALNHVVLPTAESLAETGGEFGRIRFDPLVVFALTLAGLGVATVWGGDAARQSARARTVSPLDIPMFDGDDDELLSQDLFPDSHPPTRQRIDRLQDLAGTIET